MPVPLPAICTISAAVVSAAMAMPAMPKTLPRIEVVGWDRPFKAWMKHTEAARYSRVTRFIDMASTLFVFLPEHLQHPPRDQEAAEDVDGGQRHGQHAHGLAEGGFRQGRGQHGPDDDD